ncbi:MULTISPECIES: hypothetical protein [Thalassospira]|uniref:DUF7662 domain-containing protein n=1 Tax=Thalassospira TaxID=168934 RepID=UPI0007A49339|nr:MULTISPECIES: hypothetical protein [Thalassospira]KZB73492.1 hypothetical protein AUQ43_17395 [Thalassospira sp. MCCC 1A01148]
MSRYDELSTFLSSRNICTLKMTFRELEDLLGFSLPSSAYKYQEWWANNPIPGRQSHSWLSVGWKTENLDVAGQSVSFRQIGHKQSADRKQERDKTATRPQMQSVPSSSNDLPMSVQVSVEMKWRYLGPLTLDANGDVVFPSAPTVPGLYRFRLMDNDDAHHYIGETAGLRRRFQHYRTPGPSQKTNIRVNALFKEHLGSGGCVEVDIIVDGVKLLVGGTMVDADLNDKASRRLLENAALVTEGGTDISTLNR